MLYNVYQAHFLLMNTIGTRKRLRGGKGGEKGAIGIKVENIIKKNAGDVLFMMSAAVK